MDILVCSIQHTSIQPLSSINCKTKASRGLPQVHITFKEKGLKFTTHLFLNLVHNTTYQSSQSKWKSFKHNIVLIHIHGLCHNHGPMPHRMGLYYSQTVDDSTHRKTLKWGQPHLQNSTSNIMGI